MSIKSFAQATQKLLVLGSILGLGVMPVAPASAGHHSEPLESSTEVIDVESEASAGNIVEVAAGGEIFNTLVAAVEAAELVDLLADSSASYTVFAPTDEAFSQLPEGALEFLLQPENQPVLQQVLSYHVLPEAVTSGEISGGEVETLDGELITEVTDEGVIVNNANVITADIQASNGVIHAVDQVLLSEELQATLESELGTEEAE
ncbi:MAG: fasciclin domain-containing protein [Cyanobacteria bacterium J06621_8]